MVKSKYSDAIESLDEQINMTSWCDMQEPMSLHFLDPPLAFILPTKAAERFFKICYLCFTEEKKNDQFAMT